MAVYLVCNVLGVCAYLLFAFCLIAWLRKRGRDE